MKNQEACVYCGDIDCNDKKNCIVRQEHLLIDKEEISQAVDYFTAPMYEGDMIVLAQLLVRYHNSITQENSSLYGAKMDKAICSDTFSTLFRKGPYEKLIEIQSHFVKGAK